MFDQILNIVKEQISGHPQAAHVVPAEHADAVHQEIAGAVESTVKTQAASPGGIGSMLSSLAGVNSGNPVANTVTSSLTNTLTSKFGLPPAATAAIAAAIPGILQKFAHKANDPNDHSITADGILGSLGGGKGLGSALGGLF